jgi:hypothetical protein
MVTLRALARSIGEAAANGRLLQDVFEEVWGQPLLHRRPRGKPRELKGTPPSFAPSNRPHWPGHIQDHHAKAAGIIGLTHRR